MMDYLEELLPEEDGEALALELGQQVVPRRMEEPGAGQELSPPAPGEGAEVPVVQPMGRADADELWAPLEEKGRRTAWLREAAQGKPEIDIPETALPAAALGEEMASSRRTVGAAALLEDLSRARQVADYGASTGGGPVRLSVPQAGPAVGGGLELEALDRAVQRDARRYDGGFALF